MLYHSLQFAFVGQALQSHAELMKASTEKRRIASAANAKLAALEAAAGSAHAHERCIAWVSTAADISHEY